MGFSIAVLAMSSPISAGNFWLPVYLLWAGFELSVDGFQVRTFRPGLWPGMVLVCVDMQMLFKR
jgi:hypothetical protein